jgi:DNA invertase Pin-like site-specific DNA recombinase
MTTVTAIVAIAALALSAQAAAADPVQVHSTLSQGAGMRGKPSLQVHRIQRALQGRGYSVGRPGADGRFGPLTAAAVRRLQVARGLRADGIVGRRTLRALGLARPAAGPAQPAADTPAATKPPLTSAPAPASAQTPAASPPVGSVPALRSPSGSDTLATVVVVAVLALLGALGIVALSRALTRRKGEPDAAEPAAARHEGEPMIGYMTMAAGATSAEHDRAIDAIAQACRASGRDLIDVVCDSPGGRSLERPGLSHALGRIADREARGLVVSELRGFSGSLRELAALLAWFRDADATLVAVDLDLDTSTPEGQQVAATLIALSSQDEDADHAATDTGHLHAVPNGRPAVKDRPELLERIAAMRADGMSLREIAEHLNAEQVPTPRGGALWRPSSIQAALGYKRPGRYGRLPRLASKG